MKKNCLGTFFLLKNEMKLVIFPDEMFVLHHRGVLELGLRLHLLVCNITDCLTSRLFSISGNE